MWENETLQVATRQKKAMREVWRGVAGKIGEVKAVVLPGEQGRQALPRMSQVDVESTTVAKLFGVFKWTGLNRSDWTAEGGCEE